MTRTQTLQEIQYSWNIVLVRQMMAVLRHKAESLAGEDEGPLLSRISYLNFILRATGSSILNIDAHHHLFFPSTVQAQLGTLIKWNSCSVAP